VERQKNRLAAGLYVGSDPWFVQREYQSAAQLQFRGWKRTYGFHVYSHQSAQSLPKLSAIVSHHPTCQGSLLESVGSDYWRRSRRTGPTSLTAELQFSIIRICCSQSQSIGIGLTTNGFAL
jgi:hypothetical protein